MFSIHRITSLTLAGGALVALGACTSLPVTTDANPAASVGSCHTFAWAQEHVMTPGTPGAFGNPLNSDRLRHAIETNLAARGIVRAADHTAPDCVVGYSIGSRVVANEYAGWGWGLGYGYGWGRRGAIGVGYDFPPVSNEGRISLDVFDAHTRTAIWHASVNQNVVDLTGPAAELKINQAAAAIFTKFPVVAVPAGAVPAPVGPAAAHANT